ncbi:glycosyltransferase family 2 protein [Actinobacillus pleuropneumoniae]|uniref:glycosyltransferase family 2 protein n=1 Tax=Actinobacillus pleuropneumoniae TaxID=715 RepID=UPI001F3C2C42|nr:glycosyltransferase family 2 protein [Actinobacillus pleuropneumoniae]UKH25100.1 glycosyltransferase [Actinobacillus pleuropneumoniae]
MGDEKMIEERTLPSLAIVVPCYNESESFSYCLTELSNIINNLIKDKKIKSESYILFVDDGSKDDTWIQIENATLNSPIVRGIKLSRNKGHQIALMAGLSVVDTDVSISIDADLQDDTNCIEQMLNKYMEGNEIVYGVRNNRSTDTAFKRGSAGLFYKLMSTLGVEQVENHADYRLLSKKALNALIQYKEQNVYIRGMIPLIGFKSEKVFYSRSERIAGESKYPLKKMLALAIEGITSLSITPLRLISLLGFLTCFFSFLMIVWALCLKLLGNSIGGWTSVVIAIAFLGGIQLLSLGVIGEYIGKIYIESKKRPKFFIEKFLSNEEK